MQNPRRKQRHHLENPKKGARDSQIFRLLRQNQRDLWPVPIQRYGSSSGLHPTVGKVFPRSLGCIHMHSRRATVHARRCQHPIHDAVVQVRIMTYARWWRQFLKLVSSANHSLMASVLTNWAPKWSTDMLATNQVVETSTRSAWIPGVSPQIYT
jgi:hypothetical protein